MNARLSKSRFQKGLQCEKALWLAVNRRDLAPPTPEARQWIFDQGTEVGKLAQQLLPGGLEVAESHLQPAEALATTRQLLAEGATVLYEPAFEYGAAFARVDILASAGDGRWDLFEVKSSTSVKPEHVTDAAVQAYAVEGSGLELRSINVVHIDNTYVWPGGEYDPRQLFVVADVTTEARGFMASVPDHLARLTDMLAGPEPTVRIGAQCASPYECDYREHCAAFLPREYPVTALPRLTEPQLHALLDAGITCILDVPNGFPGLNTAQRETVAVVQAGQASADNIALREALSALTWPVYHLDFETVNPALPLWPGTRPYQRIPFQYSVHVHGPDGATQHREYLHRAADDPRPALIERLVADLGTSGSIIHYTAYERGVLAELAEAFPEHADALAGIVDRLFDLEPVIRRNTRHPQAGGRSSIKYVLPAWCPDLSYADLSIADGQTASVRYLRAIRGLARAEECEATFADLVDYCGLDTYAMVRLLDEMRRLAG